MNSYYPIEVKPLDNYKLSILFDNQELRIFDVTPYLSDTFFAPLSDINIFRTVRVTSISIEWDGDIDICPDELYYNSLPIQKEGLR